MLFITNNNFQVEPKMNIIVQAIKFILLWNIHFLASFVTFSIRNIQFFNQIYYSLWLCTS
jgi:hypothetical protein